MAKIKVKPGHEGLYVKGRTPGEWVVDNAGDGESLHREIRRNPDGNTFPNVKIATVYETSVMQGEPMHLESDAALIAAAPEMQEALKDARKALADVLDNCPYFFPDRGDSSKLTAEQRAWREKVIDAKLGILAAIAKAEGMAK